MRTFHFCAMKQIEPGMTTYLDGTVTIDADFRDVNAYQKLKADIGAKMNPVVKNGDGLIIMSLTRIDA